MKSTDLYAELYGDASVPSRMGRLVVLLLVALLYPVIWGGIILALLEELWR